LKIGKVRRQLGEKNDFLTMSKRYVRLNFSAISLLRAQPPKKGRRDKINHVGLGTEKRHSKHCETICGTVRVRSQSGQLTLIRTDN